MDTSMDSDFNFRLMTAGPNPDLENKTLFHSLSLRAPERCVAISLNKAGLLHFVRNDNFLNRDFGQVILAHPWFFYYVQNSY